MICSSATNVRRFEFPKTSRLRKRREFLRVQKTGTRTFTKHFIVFSAENDGGQCRVGITASKRVGNAVERNRWKRRIREAFRQVRDRMESGKDIVVIARSGVALPSLSHARRELLVVEDRLHKNR